MNKVLAVYDTSFRDLVEKQSPKSFRDFLLSAPHMFLELGEKLGAISHIVGFWRYRFSPGNADIDGDALSAICQDFSSGFGEKIKGESSLIKKPVVIDTTAASCRGFEVRTMIDIRLKANFETKTALGINKLLVFRFRKFAWSPI